MMQSNGSGTGTGAMTARPVRWKRAQGLAAPLLAAGILALLSACAPDLTALDAVGGVIVAKQVSGELPLDPPLDPDDARWQETASRTLDLYPQQSVSPASPEADVRRVEVRALHNGKALALRLEWRDTAASDTRDVGRFADAAALQWPLHYGPGQGLPYIGMGQGGQPAAVWFWRADGSTESLAAAGFGTLTAQTPDGMTAQGTWKDGVWRVVFTRAFATGGEDSVAFAPDAQGLVPLALAVWNGEDGERNGLKRLSAWRVLYLEKGKVDPAYVQQLADAAVAPGNPDSGRRLMTEKGCIACHAFPDNPAQPTIGPGLRYAGGIHRADYLLESILEPSKVVVPGKGFFSVQDGQRVSLMPPFQGSEQERQDLVAYLKTLR